MSIFTIKQYDMMPTRVEETMAMSVRVAQYPDGRKIMQGAYRWQEGFRSGVTWKDLPLVMVDSNGQEFVDD
jgi:hypothetical protein